MVINYRGRGEWSGAIEREGRGGGQVKLNGGRGGGGSRVENVSVMQGGGGGGGHKRF